MSNLGPEAYSALVELGSNVVLPEDPFALNELGLRVICSQGCPTHLTPYSSVVAVATFVLDRKNDPLYKDGEVLLKAALAHGALDEVE